MYKCKIFVCVCGGWIMMGFSSKPFLNIAVLFSQ